MARGVEFGYFFFLTVTNITQRNSVQPRRWGMMVDVTDDGTPANNTTWVLVKGLSNTNINDNTNWQTLADYAGGSATPPGGNDTEIQFNDGGAFGGFGEWDGSNMIVPGTVIGQNGGNGFNLRESAANPYNSSNFSNWAFWDTTGSSGQVDRNIFESDTITDSIVTILIFAQGISADGGAGISKVISASFRKDGTADPVQIGANTDLVSKEDSGDTPTISVGLGAVGTDNIRISYDSNSIAVYTWTFFAIISFTKVV